MSWFFLTIFSVFTASFASILQRVLMKGEKSNPYSYAIFFHFLLAILNFVFGFFNGFEVPTIGDNLVFILISSGLWGACSIFLFKALQLLESSEVTILSSFGVVVTIIASVIFLDESFSIQKALGAALIIASIVIVTQVRKGFQWNVGVFYVIGMAVTAGLAFVADSFNVQNYDPVSYNAVANLLTGMILLLCYPKFFKQFKHFIEPTFLKKMLPLGIFSTVQAIAYLTALSEGGNTSEIATIRQAQGIVTVILAVIFLQERNNLIRKAIAAIMVTMGIFLVK